ncbi:hypothetical protein [Polyangium sorediatum]|uniref:Uncharacterized protein n=1 Tax=Polyangium sorediatum TaxID=889274 RepID=A0ABT6NWP1_9BACT|nr:hypothetical protein [Polyangium sorediatum]MDI1432738.1 hypothetical protein [Polyangium sorediatum]
MIGALAALVAATLVSTNAHADLAEDADRLAGTWKDRGAETSRLAPLFLDHGRNKRFVVPQDSADEELPGCTTVVLLGAPSADFAVLTASEADLPPLPAGLLPHGHPALDPEDRGTKSSLGVVSLVRCGPRRKDLASLVVSMRSPRGAIEILVARSPAPLGDLRDALPERAFGLVAPRGNPGRPIEPGPLAERTVRAEERARSEGADRFTRVPMVASVEGAGEYQLRLGEGCHRLQVMAAVPSTFPHRATDVDAEARDDAGRMLARDRSEAADARLDFCLGEATRVTVPFAGAAGMVPMMVIDSVWPIPRVIPNYWGARTRAGFAFALRRRNAPEPTAAPVFESLGVAGPTMVPVTLEPGRCYLAALAVARGESRGLRLAATVGDRYMRDEVVDRPEGAVLAFCAESEESARIDVEARGSGVWWTFALFALGGGEP